MNPFNSCAIFESFFLSMIGVITGEIEVYNVKYAKYRNM